MKKSLFVLSLAGTVFSGYISGVKLFSQTCAFGETCPDFFGYPACYFGFIFFFLLTVLTGMLLWCRTCEQKTLNTVVLVSFMGVLFAGYYSIVELPLLAQNGFAFYTFGLPTCMLGFLFFLGIFILSLVEKKHSPNA